MVKEKSPDLVCRDRSFLLLVDIQQRLVPAMHEPDALIQNINRLVRAAGIFQIPLIISEQYPAGLGPTVDQIELDHSDPIRFEKTTFSCREQMDIFERQKEMGRDQAIIAGIESHICVMQTAMDLFHSGFPSFLVADAISSRNPDHQELARFRAIQQGIQCLPCESVLFEWCESAQHPDFRSVSRLIR